MEYMLIKYRSGDIKQWLEEMIMGIEAKKRSELNHYQSEISRAVDLGEKKS